MIDWRPPRRRELVVAHRGKWSVDAASDADLISVSREDPSRFAGIYDRHAATLFRFLVRRVGRDTADELLGETFRVAFEKRATLAAVRSG